MKDRIQREEREILKDRMRGKGVGYCGKEGIKERR